MGANFAPIVVEGPAVVLLVPTSVVPCFSKPYPLNPMPCSSSLGSHLKGNLRPPSTQPPCSERRIHPLNGQLCTPNGSSGQALSSFISKKMPQSTVSATVVVCCRKRMSQGMTSVGPNTPNKSSGFSPCKSSLLEHAICANLRRLHVPPQSTVSENVVVCCSAPDVAVTVTVDVTG